MFFFKNGLIDTLVVGMRIEDKVELSPDPVFLIQSLRHIGYTLDTALADVIDNSISAGATEISVRFSWHSAMPWIAIIDNGCGMSPDEIREAMRFGGMLDPSMDRQPNDMGRFGLGLKTASLSQCRRLTVISKKDGEISSCVWDVDELSREHTSKWHALLPTIEDLKQDEIILKLLPRLNEVENGTIVLWHKMDYLSEHSRNNDAKEYFSKLLVQASEHIGMVFHRFFIMENGSKVVKIDFNGTKVEGINPFGIAVPSRQELTEEDLVIDGQKIHIQPYILSHRSKISKPDYEKIGGKEGYLHNQGFFVYRNRRLIFRNTWFGITQKAELTKLLRIRIDIPNSLDHLWQLDVKKSHAKPPLVVLKRLKELIPKLLEMGKRPYTRRAERTLGSHTVKMWTREIKDGKVSYMMNIEHPLVQSLVADENGKSNAQKVSLLRIISGMFPTEPFRIDANNEASVEIVSPADSNDIQQALRQLIAIYNSKCMSKEVIFDTLVGNELPLEPEQINALIEEVVGEGNE